MKSYDEIPGEVKPPQQINLIACCVTIIQNFLFSLLEPLGIVKLKIVDAIIVAKCWTKCSERGRFIGNLPNAKK